MPTLYEILGLERQEYDDINAIRKKYKKLALQWHPDKHSGDRKLAEEKFKEIQAAYEFLSDEQKRRDYKSWCESKQGKGSNNAHDEIASYESWQRSPQQKPSAPPPSQNEGARTARAKKPDSAPHKKQQEEAAFFQNASDAEKDNKYDHKFTFIPKKQTADPLKSFHQACFSELDKIFEADFKRSFVISKEHFPQKARREFSFAANAPLMGFQAWRPVVELREQKTRPHVVILAPPVMLDRIIVELLVASLVKEVTRDLDRQMKKTQIDEPESGTRRFRL